MTSARRSRWSTPRAAGVALMEAFMYRFHPLWLLPKSSSVRGGAIGELDAIQAFFSYRNVDRRTSATCTSTAAAL